MDERLAVVERLRQATCDHDLDALVGCFASDYRNDTPAHPERGFVGNDQVRTNWQRIFAAVPDVVAEVLHATSDPEAVWTEWEMRGTRPDGLPHLMRGVIIFGIADQQIAWARFYLEPVEEASGGVDAAVGRVVGAPAGS